MKFIVRRRNPGAIINITPLIDCMFLLVIFILIAARFDIAGGIPVNLPKAKSQAAPKTEAINVSVTKEGGIYLERDELTPDQLVERLTEAKAKHGDDVVLVINGDVQAMHGKVVEALNAATRAGVRMVSIRTRQ